MILVFYCSFSITIESPYTPFPTPITSLSSMSMRAFAFCLIPPLPMPQSYHPHLNPLSDVLVTDFPLYGSFLLLLISFTVQNFLV